MESSDPQASALAVRQLEALADVGSLLEQGPFDYWLFGGWAVDFHVGAITRDHGDIDLAVWAGEAEAIRSALISSGWKHKPEPDEDGGTGYERDGIRVELTYLVGGGSDGVFIPLRERNVLWSDRPLRDDVLELGGVRARVVPLELLRRGKSIPRDDPDEAEIDRADFSVLSRLVP
jgi:hypothetical protein